MRVGSSGEVGGGSLVGARLRRFSRCWRDRLLRGFLAGIGSSPVGGAGCWGNLCRFRRLRSLRLRGASRLSWAIDRLVVDLGMRGLVSSSSVSSLLSASLLVPVRWWPGVDERAIGDLGGGGGILASRRRFAAVDAGVVGGLVVSLSSSESARL